MVKKDCKQVYTLLMEYLKKFEVFFEFTQEEFDHFMLPREGVIDAFVVEDCS
jgi:glycylpeptide N-tetradecanoyltransferase